MSRTKKLWVFPGQGSQVKGMGAALFDRYPELVAQADGIVGCSLRELCLNDPRQQLSQTQYTQPAMFVVSALSFLQRRETEGTGADIYAGHSLGEFNALFAAGAFDFATGVALVTRRGRLMAAAARGAMAAVIGIGEHEVRALLQRPALDGVDVANINSALQVVLSGPVEQIAASEPLFTQAGARFVHLNVSAPFHSRWMRGVQDEFAAHVATLALRPLGAQVIANCTAQPYPRSDYGELLVRQITQPVRWYESMSRLLSRHEVELTEIGPGDVLTHLQFKIRQAPMPVRDEPQSAAGPGAAGAAAQQRQRRIFMYSGQGSQYYGMGRELFQHNAVFRQAMQECADLCRPLTGRDLLGELYDESRRHQDLDDIELSHPALFSVAYALTQVMLDAGLQPDGVLGYSLGELVAATVAGVLPLPEAMAAVVRQAQLVRRLAPDGGMLTILAPLAHFEGNPSLYAGCTLASMNFAHNFVVSGARSTLQALKQRLDQADMASMLLPVSHAFHSAAIAPIAPEFRRFLGTLHWSPPRLPLYSTACGGRPAQVDPEHFWRVASGPTDFPRTVDAVLADGPCRFVDLGPSGTLATFIKHGWGGRVAQAPAINQFGRNLQSLSRLFADAGT